MLVTGGSSGIGRAIAIAAARAGADVALTYRANERGARDAAREVESLGRRARILRLDLTDNASVAGLNAAVRAALGGVDAWVNNAGADVLTGPGATLSLNEKLDLLLRVDLRGTMLASWQAAELMATQDAGGVIINMSWDHVLTGMAGIEAQLFSAVKGGVLAFSKSLARTVAPRVRVNVLAPGWIETAMIRPVFEDNEYHQTVLKSIPLNRMAATDDVALAICFLLSDWARHITGEILNINGGAVLCG